MKERMKEMGRTKPYIRKFISRLQKYNMQKVTFA